MIGVQLNPSGTLRELLSLTKVSTQSARPSLTAMSNGEVRLSSGREGSAGIPNQAVFFRIATFCPGLQGLRARASSAAVLVFLVTAFHCPALRGNSEGDIVFKYHLMFLDHVRRRSGGRMMCFIGELPVVTTSTHAQRGKLPRHDGTVQPVACQSHQKLRAYVPYPYRIEMPWLTMSLPVQPWPRTSLPPTSPSSQDLLAPPRSLLCTWQALRLHSRDPSGCRDTRNKV